MKKYLATLAVVLGLLAALIVGVTTIADELSERPRYGVSENNILSFVPNPENKPIIVVGMQYYSPSTVLIDALNAKFPQYLFVYDIGAAAGSNSELTIFQAMQTGTPYYDMIITGGLNNVGGTVDQAKSFVDLSSEKFINDYLLSAINKVSVDGHVYCIPCTSTLSGIAYNVDMFEEYGWETPDTIDEFFTLCEAIQAEGIAPFSTNFKYESQVVRLLTSMFYSELMATEDGSEWLLKVQNNEANYDYLRRIYEFVERLNAAGLLTDDNYTGSLTKQRNAFWKGEYAMIEYDSAVFSYRPSEAPEFNLGIMPYPATEAANAGFAVQAEYYIAIPSYVEQNTERLAFMKEVLAWISSEEGQNYLLEGSLKVSNIRGVHLADSAASKYASEAVARGNLYTVIDFQACANKNVYFHGILQRSTRMICNGSTVDQAIAAANEELTTAFNTEYVPYVYEKIAYATESFTMLETTYYLADKIKAATGADIGLLLTSTFFRSNLASIQQGDITTDMRTFIMKSVDKTDYLTTYQMTGSQIKELLNAPIINGQEADAFVAASGLCVEFAPWNDRGERLIAVKMADGAPLSDDKLYTVAAYKGTIDDSYITATVQEYADIGPLEKLAETSLRADGTISPDIANRVKLIWPE